MRCLCPAWGSASPSQGRAVSSRSGATRLGFGFNPMPAVWARAGPGARLGAGVCVLGHLLLLGCRCHLLVLGVGYWHGPNRLSSWRYGVTEQRAMFSVGKEALCPSKQAVFFLSSLFSVLWTCCWREDEQTGRMVCNKDWTCASQRTFPALMILWDCDSGFAWLSWDRQEQQGMGNRDRSCFPLHAQHLPP